MFAHAERGHVLTGWRATIPAGALAVVDTSGAGPADGFRNFLGTRLADRAETSPPLDLEEAGDYGAGIHHTQHLYGPGLQWQATVIQLGNVFGFPLSGNVSSYLATRDYQPGQHYVEIYNRGPFGPALAERTAQTGFGPGTASPASRDGDQLSVVPSMFTDRTIPANAEDAFASTHVTLLRNGVQLATSDSAIDFSPQTVPPGAATYRFEAVSDRSLNAQGDPLYDLSTHVSADWTFRSQHASSLEVLPLPTLRFLPELDANNHARGPVIVLPAFVERPPGAATPRITRISIDASFDDGATWRPVPGAALGDRWIGIVASPAGATFASLRGTVQDADGRQNDVEIIRAYRVGS